MSDNLYPPKSAGWDAVDRGYQDEAAAALYKDAQGGKLVGALANMNKALASMGAKLEEHFNTPYTKENALLIETTMKAIERVELQLERWHYLIYPNQRPKKGIDEEND